VSDTVSLQANLIERALREGWEQVLLAGPTAYLEREGRGVLCFLGGTAACFAWPATAPAPLAISSWPEGTGRALYVAFATGNARFDVVSRGSAGLQLRMRESHASRADAPADYTLPPSMRAAPGPAQSPWCAPDCELSTTHVDVAVIADAYREAEQRGAQLEVGGFASAGLRLMIAKLTPAMGEGDGLLCFADRQGRVGCAPNTLLDVQALATDAHGVLMRATRSAERWAAELVCRAAFHEAEFDVGCVYVGGVDGFGEACERHEGYCVWFAGRGRPAKRALRDASC
jgi:hypothetical protein